MIILIFLDTYHLLYNLLLLYRGVRSVMQFWAIFSTALCGVV